MPSVYIPSLLRHITDGLYIVQVEGTTVRAVIDDLDLKYQGMKQRLLDGSQLRSNVSVAIDGQTATLGLSEIVGPDSEIHFIPAISGGF